MPLYKLKADIHTNLNFYSILRPNLTGPNMFVKIDQDFIPLILFSADRRGHETRDAISIVSILLFRLTMWLHKMDFKRYCDERFQTCLLSW